MTDKTESIEDRHPVVAAYTPRWQAIADTLAGPSALKERERRETYLPRLAGQYRGYSEHAGRYVDEYDGYVARATPLTARASKALAGLTGMVARKPASVAAPVPLDDLLRDVTLDGRSVDQVAAEMVAEALAFGWGALAISYDEAMQRPYLRWYDHASVTSWDVVTVGGRRLPRVVVLREVAATPTRFGSEPVEQYRLYEVVPVSGLDPSLYPLGGVVQSSVWREVEDEWMPVEEPVTLARLGIALGEIPVVPLGCEWEPSKPPMEELVQLILSHYRTSADYETLLHFAGAGSVLFGSGVDETKAVKVGGASAYLASAPDADLKWVTMDASGAEPLRQAMEDKRNEMAIAIARLLLADEKRVAETEASQRIAFAGDDATLSSVVVRVERTLDDGLAWMAWWARAADTLDEARNETSVTLNREWLAQPLSAADLVQLGLEVDAGRMSTERQYWLAARGGLTEPGVTYEQEQERIAAAPAREPAPVFGDDGL
jgi:hypothetical protein